MVFGAAWRKIISYSNVTKWSWYQVLLSVYIYMECFIIHRHLRFEYVENIIAPKFRFENTSLKNIKIKFHAALKHTHTVTIAQTNITIANNNGKKLNWNDLVHKLHYMEMFVFVRLPMSILLNAFKFSSVWWIKSWHSRFGPFFSFSFLLFIFEYGIVFRSWLCSWRLGMRYFMIIFDRIINSTDCLSFSMDYLTALFSSFIHFFIVLLCS